MVIAPPLKPIPEDTCGTPPSSSIIAILDAGGTFTAAITAQGTTNHLDVDETRRAATLLKHHLNRHLQHFHAWPANVASHQPPLDVEWIDWPTENRILSEHSTPAHWCTLAARLQEYVDHLDPSQTLRGVVIIYGTDTMSFAVPALQFAVEEQTIPLIFVGANYPLLQDACQHDALGLLYSDAWPNFLTTLAYLAIMDELRPRVLLSFAGAVHHALNLRKIHESAITSIEPPPPTASHGMPGLTSDRIQRESYVFQNVLCHSKYILRNVFGHLVFAHLPDLVKPSDEQPEPCETPVRFRSDAYSSKTLVGHAFCSPSGAQLNHVALLEHRALLVETYESGTFPATQSHPFYETLKVCAKNEIPIFLSSHYGIDLDQVYEAPELEALDIVAYRLNNLIPETALPLLTLSCERVMQKESGIELRGVELAEKIKEEMLDTMKQCDGSCIQLLEKTEVRRLEL